MHDVAKQDLQQLMGRKNRCLLVNWSLVLTAIPFRSIERIALIVAITLDSRNTEDLSL